MSRRGIEPMTSRSPERTLYQLSYRGRCIVLKRKPFSRVIQEIRKKKNCKVAPKSTSSYHKVDWLSSYFHFCHDEITYFNRGVFPIRLPWHGRVVDVGHLISSQGTTDDVATIHFHPSLSSVALRESPNPIPIHSLILSSHLFFCLPLLLAPFTVPCRIVFAIPEDLEMWPYHLSFPFFTMVRRSSCTPIGFWILLQTSSFVTWSL